MPTCLMVRPAPSADPNGGDTIVYRRLTDYLQRRANLDVLELKRLTRLPHALNLCRGLPPEVGGYASAANRAALARKLAERPCDVVIFSHESTFALIPVLKPGAARKVLYAQNMQSVIANSDPGPLGRLSPALATAFDRRWCSDPTAQVVCISRVDMDGLRRIGVTRRDIAVAPPGAPPAVALPQGAGVMPELLLTGSYGWWRKRRDLQHFAKGPPLPYPILAADPTALEVLGDQARAAGAPASWTPGVRFGLITDRFQGGFKLKSVEYVALNAVVLSACDLSREFEGLPHAEEFVRLAPSKARIREIVEAFAAQPAGQVVDRFRRFKAACLERFSWERCLEPFGRALTAPAATPAIAEPSYSPALG
jgi:hypothetical protein